MNQSEFEKMFKEGLIKSVRLFCASQDGMVAIEIFTIRGHQTLIYTKRGDLKRWRVETCLRWLRGLGISEVVHDMRGQFLAEQLWAGRPASLGKKV